MDTPVKTFARAFGNRTLVYYQKPDGELTKFIVWHQRPYHSPLAEHEALNLFSPKRPVRLLDDPFIDNDIEKMTIKLPWYIVVQRVFDWVRRGVKHEPRMPWRW